MGDFLEEVVIKLKAEGTQAPGEGRRENAPGSGHSSLSGIGGPKEKVRGGHGIWAETLGVQCGRQIGETRAEAGTAVGG